MIKKSYYFFAITIMMVLFQLLNVNAQATTEEKAKVLYDLKLLNGKSSEEFIPAVQETISKGDALILLSKLFNWDIDNIETRKLEYEDIYTYQKKAISYAQKKNYIKGNTSSRFGIDITKYQFVNIVKMELGYGKNNDGNLENWALEKGLVNEIGSFYSPMTRREAIEIVYNSLTKSRKKEDKKLIEILIDCNMVNKNVVEEHDLLKGYELDFNISITDNLKRFKITFNKELSRLIKKEHLKVNNSKIEDINFGSNNREIYVTVDSDKLLGDRKYNKLLIEYAQSYDGAVLINAKKDFYVEDNKSISIKDMQYIGPYELMIEYTEPYKNSPESVSLEYEDYLITSNVTRLNETIMLVKSSRRLLEGNLYNINISGLEEYSLNDKVDLAAAKIYKSVKVPPTLKVLSHSTSRVSVEFSVPVTGVSIDNFYHTFKNYKPVEVKGKGKFYDIYFVSAGENLEGYPLPRGEVKLYVLGKNKSKIMDAWGNVFADSKHLITVLGDQKGPEIMNISPLSKNKFLVEFDEVLLHKGDHTNFQVYDLNDNRVRLGVVTSWNNIRDRREIIVYIPGIDFYKDNYKLKIIGLKDNSLEKNSNIEYYSLLKGIGD